MAKEPWKTSDLVLGWKVTKGLEPRYWGNPDAKPGRHSLDDIVKSTPRTIAHHTVIIAQSGSGKSFFLGRVLEEILLKTSSRILVLDPNSDFRKIAQPKSAERWTKKAEYRYNSATGKGFLADEPSQAEFMSRWKTLSKLVHTMRQEKGAEVTRLRLNWLKLPVDLISEDAADQRRDQLYHCHSFVNILAALAIETKNKDWLREGEFLGKARELCKETRSQTESAIVETLRKVFHAAATPGGSAVSSLTDENIVTDRQGTKYVLLPREFPTLAGLFSASSVSVRDFGPVYQRAATHRKFVLDEAERFYFSRAFEIQESELIDPQINNSFKASAERIQVVDLPSIPDARHQKMAVSAFLETEWALAKYEWEQALNKSADDDTRVLTFIVVDEAHHLIPTVAETLTEKKLQEQFRRISAEGRKFGMFLILVSQRPDKLDRMVMSECENRAVMKVGSSFILRMTSEILGLDSVAPRMTKKCLDFDIGRALLVGPWVADNPTFLVSAARRTEEGGRDLNWKHWAKPAS